ncbi:helix-hairpin-helix domain-containing protein [Bacillus sp. V5-8f]|uniref:helix-hairpin-helix domain-containing protein n=1 Tax=Bacillus sp. V5-8f TaxID=2053044 RepID=UPI000C775D96|nr:helix-hairpin-helix domain-containing protein [Bacillus sp. V5-8f]PLT34634.1 hypothetical protein CUU64_04290 [Bacillus sp. V5-8f]
MNTPRKKKIVILSLVCLISIAGYFFYQQSLQGMDNEPLTEEGETVFTAGQNELDKRSHFTGTPSKEKEPIVIKVDVKGAVQTPGVFVAEEGDRVIDVVAKAGNFTSNADKDQVNLAQLIEDEMVIYVPEIGEMSDSKVVPTRLEPSGSAANNGTQNININTAQASDLETLPGIGPSKSAAIIEYRETNGPFREVEDLKNITGIGDKTFEKLMGSISVK